MTILKKTAFLFQDSIHARKHSTLNGDFCTNIHKHMNAVGFNVTCDNQTLCGVVHERSRSAGRSDGFGGSGSHRSGSTIYGFQTSSDAKDLDTVEVFRQHDWKIAFLL